MKMKRTSLDETFNIIQITVNQKHTYWYKFNWVNRCVTTIQFGVRER